MKTRQPWPSVPQGSSPKDISPGDKDWHNPRNGRSFALVRAAGSTPSGLMTVKENHLSLTVCCTRDFLPMCPESQAISQWIETSTAESLTV